MGGRLRVLLLMLADLIGVFLVWPLVAWGYAAIGLGHHYRLVTGVFGIPMAVAFYPTRDPFFLWFGLFAFGFILVNIFMGLYHGNPIDPSAPVSPVEEFRRTFYSSLLVHLGMVALLALSDVPTKNYSRALIVLSGLTIGLLAQLLRDVVRRLMFYGRIGKIPVVVTGDESILETCTARVSSNVYTGFQVVASADPSEVVVLAKEKRLKTLVAFEDPQHFRSHLVEYLSWFTHVVCLPPNERLPISDAKVVAFDGLCGYEIVNQRRMRILRFEKWVLDRTLAICAFCLLLPFFVVIPILVKLTSRGSVFYRQQRLGRGGRTIRVWKFRSMYADAQERLTSLLSSDSSCRTEWERNFKLQNDPRVTPLGKFLRRTSLDELPQLFNVFAGDMALVGPRPIVEEEVVRYGDTYDTFSSVLPGITGLWQVSGRSDADYEKRIALDAYYVINWSPWLDLWILKRTIKAVLSMRGAC